MPTVFVSLLAPANVKEYKLDQVRTFNTGGAPVPSKSSPNSSVASDDS